MRQVIRDARGFTFVELAVVLVCVALLASLSAPLVTTWVVRAKESALRENLLVLRSGLDAYYADKGVYPSGLEDLVTARYIRYVPIEPISGSVEGWVEEFSTEVDIDGVVDIHSGSNAQSLDNSCYCDW